MAFLSLISHFGWYIVVCWKYLWWVKEESLKGKAIWLAKKMDNKNVPMLDKQCFSCTDMLAFDFLLIISVEIPHDILWMWTAFMISIVNIEKTYFRDYLRCRSFWRSSIAWILSHTCSGILINWVNRFKKNHLELNKINFSHFCIISLCQWGFIADCLTFCFIFWLWPKIPT